MTSTAVIPTLYASIDIAAPPASVWAVVSDVRRTPEWSPECRRVVPFGRLRRGTFLLGLNRCGRVRWAAVSRLTVVDAEREIAWVVLTNHSVWTYRLEPIEGGTRVVETRETPRGETAFALWFTRVLLGGQQAHDALLEQGMADGLERIRRIVESGPAHP
jgi:uncharacterized protein YndB with AHSA1/START domain